jgi:hypothetical protein
LLLSTILSGCGREEPPLARQPEVATTAPEPELDLRTRVKRYLLAPNVAEQEKLLSELPLAQASAEEKRAVAQELVERAGPGQTGWVSGNRLGIALAALGEAGDEQVPEIISRLKTRFAMEPEESSASVEHLGGMLRALGPRAKAAVPALEEALAGPYAFTAATTLAAIDPESAKLHRWLERALESRDDAILYATAGVLGALDLPDPHLNRVLDLALHAGPTPVSIRGQFLHLLLREGIETRLTEERSAEVIRFVFTNAEEFSPYFSGETLFRALPAHIERQAVRILELTRSRSASVRSTAAYVLGRIDPASPIAVQRLYDMAEDRDQYVGRDALISLLALGRFELAAAGIETRSDVFRFNLAQAAEALKKILEVDPTRLPPRAWEVSWQAELAELATRNGLRAAKLDPRRPTVPPGWTDSGCRGTLESVPPCAELLETLGPEYIESALVTEEGSILLWVLGAGRLVKLTPDLGYDARYSCPAGRRSIFWTRRDEQTRVSVRTCPSRSDSGTTRRWPWTGRDGFTPEVRVSPSGRIPA